MATPLNAHVQHATTWGPQVPALRLEDIVHLGARNYIDFLKIDVEGAELEALCSSVGWFERLAVKNLGMELNWETTVQSQEAFHTLAVRRLSTMTKDVFTSRIRPCCRLA